MAVSRPCGTGACFGAFFPALKRRSMSPVPPGPSDSQTPHHMHISRWAQRARGLNGRRVSLATRPTGQSGLLHRRRASRCCSDAKDVRGGRQPSVRDWCMFLGRPPDVKTPVYSRRSLRDHPTLARRSVIAGSLWDHPTVKRRIARTSPARCREPANLTDAG